MLASLFAKKRRELDEKGDDGVDCLWKLAKLPNDNEVIVEIFVSAKPRHACQGERD